MLDLSKKLINSGITLNFSVILEAMFVHNGSLSEKIERGEVALNSIAESTSIFLNPYLI